MFIPFDIGMAFVRNMTRVELSEIIRESTRGQFLDDDLRSLLYAEPIVVASDNGETKYLAVEIAFNANKSHANTAIRHAQLLQELSGISTIPVVATYQIDHEVRKAVDSGYIYWHYVPDHVLDSREVEKERRLFLSDDFRRVI